MLAPKKQKYRKVFRGKTRGKASRGSEISFGEYGLKALSSGQISANQIEAARRAITHFTKREGKVWIRIFPHKPVSAKAAGSRMGGGKGDVKVFVSPVIPGQILFELAGVTEEVAFEALKRAADKLPVKSKILKKS
ncbi:MAG TPA: 50S ribosomal protein L16 [Clostridia bacterium]|nr:50S ribosomal protein L16 [Clostridia bacterium]